MTACELCSDRTHIGTAHPCCRRFWNGRYCLSCEASKAYWRTQTRKRKATR